MSENLGDVDVQKKGCKALGRLAHYGGAAIDHSISKCVKAAIKAMREHPGDAGVQDVGTWALYTFATSARRNDANL